MQSSVVHACFLTTSLCSLELSASHHAKNDQAKGRRYFEIDAYQRGFSLNKG
jgi:hypothetical protein